MTDLELLSALANRCGWEVIVGGWTKTTIDHGWDGQAILHRIMLDTNGGGVLHLLNVEGEWVKLATLQDFEDIAVWLVNTKDVPA